MASNKNAELLNSKLNEFLQESKRQYDFAILLEKQIASIMDEKEPENTLKTVRTIADQMKREISRIYVEVEKILNLIGINGSEVQTTLQKSKFLRQHYMRTQVIAGFIDILEEIEIEFLRTRRLNEVKIIPAIQSVVAFEKEQKEVFSKIFSNLRI